MDVNCAERPAGEQLGIEGLDQLVERAEAICHCERQRLELTNQPLIIAKKAQYAAELEKDEELKARVYQAKPPHEHRARQRRIVTCWSVAVVLIAAGFILALYTFEPYRLGLKGLFYCLGAAVVTPYLVEKILQAFSSDKLLRVLLAISGIVAVVSLMTLAVIRGQLLGEHSREDQAPAVVVDGEEPQTTTSKTSFYEETIPLLQLVMVLLAFSMEVGAGVALHEAERVNANLGENYDALQRDRERVQARLGELAEEITRLQIEPGLFVAKFWRDFYWSVLKRSIGNAGKAFAIATVVFLLLCSSPARAQERPLELVVLVDLSSSVDATGPDGRGEFQKNIAAVSEMLKRLPAGAHVSVLGVTENSFAQPYFLLSAAVAADGGYFGERLAHARQHLEIAWRNESRELSPTSTGTDLLGAILVANQIFQKSGAQRRSVLVILSDMWQQTRQVNFSRIPELCASSVFEEVRQQKFIATLRDADVYALGVDSAGRKRTDWVCAREFWARYFHETGAALRDYSVLRNVDGVLGK